MDALTDGVVPHVDPCARFDADQAAPLWAPLSKAQCLLMAIQLRRIQGMTQRHWRLDAMPEAPAARIEGSVKAL